MFRLQRSERKARGTEEPGRLKRILILVTRVLGALVALGTLFGMAVIAWNWVDDRFSSDIEFAIRQQTSVGSDP